jgi:hypothetical protein
MLNSATSGGIRPIQGPLADARGSIRSLTADAAACSQPVKQTAKPEKCRT